jgi:hypothetical protein
MTRRAPGKPLQSPTSPIDSPPFSKAMIDINPNFAAVKQGLIPVTPQERMKLVKDGLDVVHDIYRYAKTGLRRSSRRFPG